jgi:hypothetical protein
MEGDNNPIANTPPTPQQNSIVPMSNIPTQAPLEPTQKSNKKIWLFILIPIIIIIAGGIFMFTNSISRDTNKIIDCGSSILSTSTEENVNNFDCLIEASKKCKPSKLSNVITTQVFGVLSSTTTHLELKGIEAGKCIYYQKIENSSIEFTDELVQTMLDEGKTQEEIDQQKQAANEAVQKNVGTEQTCKFETNDLTTILSKWQNGVYSGGASCRLVSGKTICEYFGDFENAECGSNNPSLNL